MAAARPDLQVLPHAIFLHRAADGAGAPRANPGDGVAMRLSQGAFLVLRLVDLLSPDAPRVHPDAFTYQWTATHRFCRDLRASSPEGAHIHGLVVSARAAARHADVNLLTPGLVAYAHFLEVSARLEEALDVLGTLSRLARGRLSQPDAIALALRVGRVNRLLNRFDLAEDGYRTAGDLAHAAGDRYSELLSQIGRAAILLRRGNLPEAERRLTEVLAEARAAGLRDAAARAEHDLATVLQHRGSPDEALLHAWRAFELYEDERGRVRALHDVGVMLLSLGDAVAAQRALGEVLRREQTRDNTANTMVELMHCASFRRDRVGFERYRALCEDAKAQMPPNVLADYYLKLGVGEARFAQFRRAATSLERALAVAEQAGLNAHVFKIERIRAGLGACEDASLAALDDHAGAIATGSAAVASVSGSVARLAGETA